ncbi:MULTISPECIES: histidine phosphatase family protein [Streptococcus]|uniref:Phosphoglycerate mutase n=1 Tax=Streptococcus viridans TaxID=78535 RepID=A0A3S4L173_9STRE|nr:MULTISPECIES: histidine phosphatase family protein [Streptococcus]VED67559.1 phosphoglycerate mutase [Streptococcus viridans]VEE19461.1 phosphoglycerate mutase [Streptococcus australis]
MKLYFFRHGRTEWNEEGRIQGANGDSPLLESSIQQLEALGQHLSQTYFDAAYSSDLPRAVHTAQILLKQNQHPITLQETPALREWRLGRLEGRKIMELKALYPEEMRAFRHNLSQFHNNLFDAESLSDTTKRTCDFVKSLKGKELDTVLIVGHGANLTASIRTLLGNKPEELRKNGGLDNASVTILTTDDFEHYHLATWNDTSYLED